MSYTPKQRKPVVAQDAEMEQVVYQATSNQSLKAALTDLAMWRRKHEQYFDVGSHRCYTRALVRCITALIFCEMYETEDYNVRQLYRLMSQKLEDELNIADVDYLQ